MTILYLCSAQTPTSAILSPNTIYHIHNVMNTVYTYTVVYVSTHRRRLYVTVEYSCHTHTVQWGSVGCDSHSQTLVSRHTFTTKTSPNTRTNGSVHDHFIPL